MATMSIRSTYALDADTAQIIRRLSRNWGVSQAEVIRRSVRLATTHTDAVVSSPAEVVAHYREHEPPRDWAETRRLVDEMRAQRHADDLGREAKPAQ